MRLSRDFRPCDRSIDTQMVDLIDSGGEGTKPLATHTILNIHMFSLFVFFSHNDLCYDLAASSVILHFSLIRVISEMTVSLTHPYWD